MKLEFSISFHHFFKWLPGVFSHWFLSKAVCSWFYCKVIAIALTAHPMKTHGFGITYRYAFKNTTGKRGKGVKRWVVFRPAELGIVTPEAKVGHPCGHKKSEYCRVGSVLKAPRSFVLLGSFGHLHLKPFCAQSVLGDDLEWFGSW